jgi:hypothetical protein
MATMRTIDLREPVDIEPLLVWTYRHQRADRVLGRGLGLFDQEAAMDGRSHCATSKDGAAAMQRIGTLGTRVSGGGTPTSALHVDAEIVHAEVMALPNDVRELIIVHARSASRPDDDAMPLPRAFPAKSANGRLVREYAAWDKSRNYGWTAGLDRHTPLRRYDPRRVFLMATNTRGARLRPGQGWQVDPPQADIRRPRPAAQC